MKQVISGLLVTVSVACAVTCGCANRSRLGPELANGVTLPKGFVPMDGLSDSEYDKDGWPKYIVCVKDGSVMALVNRPRYSMGSAKAPSESPAHLVKVERFYIDLYEVNNLQFARFAKKMSCCCKKKPCPGQADRLIVAEALPRACDDSTASQPSDDSACDRSGKTAKRSGCRKAGKCGKCCKSCLWKSNKTVQLDPTYFKEYWTPGINDSHPARAVSFWEAWHYSRWAGKDLPTEAEWELAAKGGVSQRLYPWGDVEPDSQRMLCNYGGPRAGEDGYEYTAPVSAFAAGRSKFGCYNMAGNVWEWCKDRYDASIYRVADFARGSDRQPELDRQMTNPKGPVCGDSRVLRGGAYTSDIQDCRTTGRQACRPNFHGMNIGFRTVLRIR